MRLGMCLPQLGPYASVRAIETFARRADALGFSSLWAQEHLLYPLRSQEKYAGRLGVLWPEPYRHQLSPLELLGYVGAITSQISIGTSILVTGYHRPVALAKQAATLDYLTGGRMLLGLGLGWSQLEHAQMDTPFERRGPRATDFLRALRACWKENPISYEGEFFNIPLAETSPKPLRRDCHGNPAVPIVGFWAESARARVAELCDYWQPASRTLDVALADMAAINEIAVKRFGRKPLPLMLRVFATPALKGVKRLEPAPMFPNWTGTADDMIAHVRTAKAAGVAEIVIDTNFFMQNPGEEGWMAQPDFFAPLLEACAD